MQLKPVFYCPEAEVDGKSNAAIPALLSSLDLKGAVVTIDAMGHQKAIADKLVAAKARDYVLTLNVIPHNGSSKHSLRTRKMRATLNDDYRFELIFGKAPT